MAEISARKRIWGWMMFDWASQPFYTLGLTFIFGPFFAEIAADYFLNEGFAPEAAKARAQATWSTALTLIGIFIAFTAPVLGAIADTRDRRIPWMILFSVIYIGGTWSLWYFVPGGSAITQTLIAFGLAMIAAEYMLVFINAMLPSLGTQDEMGDISGSGFALGYAGGVLSLFIVLALFAENGDSGRTLIGLAPALGLDPEAREGTRSVGPFIAIWYAVFIIPFFLWVKDSKPPRSTGTVGDALRTLGDSLRSAVRQSSLLAYLGSSMFYRDALNAFYGFGGVYAGLVLGWSITKIGVFGIIAAIAAAIFTWLGGKADKRFGPKPVVVFNVWLLILVAAVIVGMTRETLFGFALPQAPLAQLPLLGPLGVADAIMMVLGIVIGGAGGALQAASRTLMARHANPDRPAEAFGLYAFSGKATAFLAPGLIGIVTTVTESARYGLAPVVGLFIVALILLRWVSPHGRKDAAAWSAS
jgi:UMF1 family MFS transporter